MSVSLDLLETYLKSGQLLRRLRKAVVRNIYIKVDVDLRRSIIVAGSGRSGTTWLSEIINFDNRFRFIFEPIRPEVVPSLSHFAHKQYLRADCDDKRYREPIETILRGGVRNSFLDKHNMRFFSRRALIKIIRGHLMLHWIHRQFPMIPIVFILRHPCAVACSKQRIGWDTEELEGFLKQKELVEDHLSPFVGAIKESGSDFERHVLIWCIENYVALKELRTSQVFVTFYENLLENRDGEFERLFSYLGEVGSGSIPDRIGKPSATAVGHREPTMRRIVDSWRGQLTPNQVDRCVRILELFGLDTVYDDGSYPKSRVLQITQP